MFDSLGTFRIVSLVFELRGGDTMCLSVFEFRTSMTADSMITQVLAVAPGAAVVETVLIPVALNIDIVVNIAWTADLLDENSAAYQAQYQNALLMFDGFGYFEIVSLVFELRGGDTMCLAIFEFQTALTVAELTDEVMAAHSTAVVSEAPPSVSFTVEVVAAAGTNATEDANIAQLEADFTAWLEAQLVQWSAQYPAMPAISFVSIASSRSGLFGGSPSFVVGFEDSYGIFELTLMDIFFSATFDLGDGFNPMFNAATMFTIFENGVQVYPPDAGLFDENGETLLEERSARRRRSTDNLLGDEEVKALLLMQVMTSQQNVGVNNILPFVLLNDDRNGNVLKFVLFNAMSGGLNSQNGFNSNFFILYKLMEDSSTAASDKSDIALILFAMQAQNPSSSVDSMSLVPFLLMDDSSNNEELILFLEISRQQNRSNCNANRPVTRPAQPQIQQQKFMPARRTPPAPQVFKPAPQVFQQAPVKTVPVKEVSQEKWNAESLQNFLQSNPNDRLG